MLIRLGGGLGARGAPPWSIAPLLAAGFVLALVLLRLPVRWTADALWPAGSGGEAVTAQLAAVPATVLAGGLGLWLLLQLAGVAPRRGWLWLGGLSMLVIFALVVLAPVTLTPRIRHDVPVAAGGASGPILAFVARGGMGATSLYSFAGAGAADVDVEGLGPFIHVAVSSAALAAPQPQTYAALGHLLGHYRYKDLLSLALLWSASGLALCWAVWRGAAGLARRLGEGGVADPGDPAALPVMGLIAWAWLALAVLAFNGFDQAINYRADDYALALTRDPDALCRWLMGAEAADKPDPSPLEALIFYDHPPLKARLINAQGWAQGRKFAHPPPRP